MSENKQPEASLESIIDYVIHHKPTRDWTRMGSLEVAIRST